MIILHASFVSTYLVFVCFIQFKSLAPLYYRDAAAAILVYDITSDVS